MKHGFNGASGRHPSVFLQKSTDLSMAENTTLDGWNLSLFDRVKQKSSMNYQTVFFCHFRQKGRGNLPFSTPRLWRQEFVLVLLDDIPWKTFEGRLRHRCFTGRKNTIYICWPDLIISSICFGNNKAYPIKVPKNGRFDVTSLCKSKVYAMKPHPSCTQIFEIGCKFSLILIAEDDPILAILTNLCQT